MATRTVLRSKDTAGLDDLYLSFERGDKKWRISMGDRRGKVSRYTVGAGDTVAVGDASSRERSDCGQAVRLECTACCEAGRDGWWVHRWLTDLSVDNIVVHPASIEVNWRARRAKTDRLDGDKLMAMLIRHHTGEHVWSVLREPNHEDEDARRAHHELASSRWSSDPVGFTPTGRPSHFGVGYRGGSDGASRIVIRIVDSVRPSVVAPRSPTPDGQETMATPRERSARWVRLPAQATKESLACRFLRSQEDLDRVRAVAPMQVLPAVATARIRAGGCDRSPRASPMQRCRVNRGVPQRQQFVVEQRHRQ